MVDIYSVYNGHDYTEENRCKEFIKKKRYCDKMAAFNRINGVSLILVYNMGNYFKLHHWKFTETKEKGPSDKMDVFKPLKKVWKLFSLTNFTFI